MEVLMSISTADPRASAIHTILIDRAINDAALSELADAILGPPRDGERRPLYVALAAVRDCLVAGLPFCPPIDHTAPHPSEVARCSFLC
jgi:hypothetical protein